MRKARTATAECRLGWLVRAWSRVLLHRSRRHHSLRTTVHAKHALATYITVRALALGWSSTTHGIHSARDSYLRHAEKLDRGDPSVRPAVIHSGRKTHARRHITQPAAARLPVIESVVYCLSNSTN